jgi:type VI secretion system protein ImpK
MHTQILPEKSLLFTFEDFYREVVLEKSYIEHNTWIQSGETAENSTERIIRRLEVLLNNQNYSTSYCDENDMQYITLQEVRYVMAAMADEVFLKLNWQGRQYWEKNILEERVFNSHIAGRNFFKNIDNILSYNGQISADLPVIYLAALSLGFKGRYGKQSDNEELQSYKSSLFTMINHQSPTILESSYHLFPNTLMHTMEGQGNTSPVRRAKWNIIMSAVIIIYIGASYCVWSNNTANVFEELRILLQMVK